MPAISYFNDKFSPVPTETVECNSGITLEQWLIDNIPSYSPYILDHPISILANDEFIAPEQWSLYTFSDDDIIHIFHEPKGPIGDAVESVFNAFTDVVGAVIGYFYKQDIPDNYNSSYQEGSSIYSVNVQGNQPKLMGIVPEIFGSHKTYFDLLNAPHRYYSDDEEYLLMFCSVGVGWYYLPTTNITIGNSPVSNYAGDIDATTFNPEENVTSHPAYKNVYTSPEVGSTSSSAGIELEGPTNSVTPPLSYLSGSKVILYEDSSGFLVQYWPTEWEVGKTFTITNSAADDGTYKVISTTSTYALVDKQGGIPWLSFVESGETSGITFTAVETLPGAVFGPIQVTPSTKTTNKIMVDILYSDGIGYINDNGSVASRTLETMLEWRELGTTTWNQVPISRTAATRDQLANTIDINIETACRCELRCYRVTTKSSDARTLDTIELVRVKCELDSNTSYENITTIALRIKATNSLSNAAENKFAGVPTRMLEVPDGNGGWTTELQATNDIAPVHRYIAKRCGFTDAMIANTQLLRLHDVWSERGDEFNGIFDASSTHFSVQQRVLAVGYAQPTLDYGQLIAVRDEKKDGNAYMYQPDNMTSELKIKINNFQESDYDSVEVEYFEKSTWKSDTILCKLDSSLGINPKSVKAYGVTDRAQAWRFGMREARIIQYRRKGFSFSTELDALNSSLLSRADLGWNVPGYGQNGRIKQIVRKDGYLSIFTNQVLEWSDTSSFVVAIRRPDGTRFGPVSATKGIARGELRITDELDFNPCFDGAMEPPFFMFGVEGKWCFKSLIMDITPNGSTGINVEASTYDERVYDDDDNEPPEDLMVGYETEYESDGITLVAY
jgi:hypothetical protein